LLPIPGVTIPKPDLSFLQRPTAHQWAVYDLVRKIPVGKVTTYKVRVTLYFPTYQCVYFSRIFVLLSARARLAQVSFTSALPIVCDSAGAVGGALRNNPFAPFVPCHRIIASNHYIGGFYGEWGQNAGTGKQCHRKKDMLGKEGVAFTDKGYLVGGDEFIWRG
jgi:methylated-DNA-[protein]-cysteine S-methyltransferase